MKQTKRFFAVLLAVIMLTSTFVFTSSAATLVWPVPGHTSLSQGFHDGKAIDISDGSIAGATVVAAMGGTVTKAFYCGEQHFGSMGDCQGFGTGIVILGDDNRYYQYAHMQGNSIPSNVYVGVRVNAGQKIGSVGTTGNSSGNHLHFGITTGNWWNESGINPQNETYTYDLSSDKDAPVISDIAVSNERDKMLVTCTVRDNVAVSWTQFAVWRADKSVDTAVWYPGTLTTDGSYCVIDKADFNNYEGFFKCKIFAVDLAGNTGTYTIPFDVFIGNLVTVWDITDLDNHSFNYNLRSNPQTCGTIRVWFREYDLDYNYYLNVYIDDVRVVYNKGSDQNGYLFYDINLDHYSKGQHHIKVELYDTRTMYSDEILIQNINHSFTSKITIPATCSATGVRTYTCSCGDSYTETIPKNASNHVNTTNVAATASTCTVSGYTAGVYCNDCKQYISGHQQQPLAAHTITIINQRDATQDAEGYTGDEYCTVCKQTIIQGTVIQKLDKPTDPTPDTPPYPQPENGCKWCGKTHTGFFGGLVGFFHRIFAALFGARH